MLDWFSANARDLPWRRTRDPYAIWVSEIMLQQTQVKTVIPYWNHWMRELPTIEAVAKARSEKIHKLWEGLGYYTRARNLQMAAKLIMGKHDGRFPDNFEDVLALPGIGRYTAGAICSIAFNQPTPILDGNVIRVLARVFGLGEIRAKRKPTLGFGAWRRNWWFTHHALRFTSHIPICGRERGRRARTIWLAPVSTSPSWNSAHWFARREIRNAKFARLKNSASRFAKTASGNCRIWANAKPPPRDVTFPLWLRAMDDSWSASGPPESSTRIYGNSRTWNPATPKRT